MRDINSFSGTHSFLSNFHPAPVYILIGTKWVRCPTLEHGFQASKTLSAHHRRRIVEASTPGQAKRLGNARGIHRVSYWDDAKTIIMLELLRQKFSRSEFARKLRNTGDARLIEGNNWHDNFWGVCLCGRDASSDGKCDGTGQNWLGRLLTRVRKDIGGGR